MNKYGPKAQAEIHKALDERQHGTLRSGQSNRKVTSRKQAIAIGISKARDKHYKVPSPNHKS